MLVSSLWIIKPLNCLISLKNVWLKIKENQRKSKKNQTIAFRYKTAPVSLQPFKAWGRILSYLRVFFKTVAPCRVQKSVFKHPIDPCEIRRGISLQKCTENRAGTLFVQCGNCMDFVTKTSKSFDFSADFFKGNQRNQTLQLQKGWCLCTEKTQNRRK